MKRFIVSVLCVSVFFLGLGTLIEKAGARFKSDEKALALIKAARTAIGGDSAISNVQSLRIKGATTHTFKIDGTETTETGETEIAMQLPDKLSKTVRIGRDDGISDERSVQRRSEVIVLSKDDSLKSETETTPGLKRVIVSKGGGGDEELKTESGGRLIIRKGDGDLPTKLENGEIRNIKVNREEMEAKHRQAQQNELFRLALGLLLSPPVGLAVNYTFGGEVTAADTPCNLVIADVGGSPVKLYLDRSSNLPVMMSYTGEHMPMLVHIKKETPASTGSDDKDVVFFRRTDGPEAQIEFSVRFSDYRNTGGVQLPYRWTTSAGEMREVFEVANYEVNPPNISDSFQEPKMMRMKKEDQ